MNSRLRRDFSPTLLPIFKFYPGNLLTGPPGPSGSGSFSLPLLKLGRCRLLPVEPLPDVGQEMASEHLDHGDGKGAWPVLGHAERVFPPILKFRLGDLAFP